MRRIEGARGPLRRPGDAFGYAARRARGVLIVCLVIQSLCFSAAADPSEVEESEGAEERYHLLTFLALGTYEYEFEGVTVATLGVDYEWRFSPLLGVGFVAEHALEDINETTVLAVADVHVWRSFVIQIGPGAAIVTEPEEPVRTEFAFRVGLIYEIELGRLAITPQLHYDYTTGKDAVVFGSGIGWRF